MFRRRIFFALAVAALGIFSLPSGRAEPLPPSAYAQLQAQAPEELVIEVLKVQREPAENLQEEWVRVTAVALQVKRSAAQIEKGDFLQIAYVLRFREDGRPERGQVPLLEEGQRTIAFLQPAEGKSYFVPAAGAMSFSRF